METIDKFKEQRKHIGKVVSIPIDAKRAKFDENERTVKGYAIVWGSKNDFNEIVLKGATLNSLNARGVESEGKNKIVLLRQHRMDQPIGYFTVLREDDYGLYFEAELIEGTQASNEALAEIRQGVLSQLSYGFSYIWDKTEYDDQQDAFILREIKLWEISVVTFSSDENAQLRSFNDFQADQKLGVLSMKEMQELQTLLQHKLSRDEHSDDDEEEQEEESNNNKVKFF